MHILYKCESYLFIYFESMIVLRRLIICFGDMIGGSNEITFPTTTIQLFQIICFYLQL